LPGEIVDLPEFYKGETWLEPVEKKPKKIEVPPATLEPAPVPAEVKATVPFEATKKKKKSKS